MTAKFAGKAEGLTEYINHHNERRDDLMRHHSFHKGFTGMVFCLGFAAVLLHCERAAPLQQKPTETTFTSIQQNIFDNNCALSGCHLGSSAPFGLDLSQGNAYNNLVDVASGEVPTLFRVKPGDPDNSYIVMKLEGAQGIQGQRMPRGRPPLAPDDINAVREWIRLGAKNN